MPDLQKERAARLTGFVRSLFPQSNLELFQEGGNRDSEKQEYLESSGASAELVNKAVDGLHDALDGRIPEGQQLEALEAIVLKDQCPTVEIVNDDFDPPRGRWARLQGDREWLGSFIKGAGRVDCAALAEPYVGSGLLVAPDLVMTNRHVARVFADGIGTKEALKPRFPAEFDYRRERSAPLVRDPVRVAEVLLIHPYWDVAVLRVETSGKHQPLTLASEAPATLDGHEIAVIGYPYFSFLRNDYESRVLLDNFGDKPGFKRLQPGRLTQRIAYFDDKEAWPRVLALGHNASTLGGNSGSLVVSLNDRRVLAVHFAGQAYVTNWAVPTWELYRDARLRDLGIQFTGSAAKPEADEDVEAAWAKLGPKSPAVTVPLPRSTDADAVVTPRANGAVGALVAATSSPAPAPSAAAAFTAPPASAEARVIIVPLEISVRLLAPEVGARSALPAPEARAGAGVAAGALERIDVDPRYERRDGYDPDYLDVPVPLPTLTDAAMAQVSRDLTRDGDDNHLLHYHHFSLVMNKRRRIAFFTACNTTRDEALFGGKSRGELSGGDTWILDPRIPPHHQITTAEFYKGSPFDRGHIVRREDAYWGQTQREREWGNFDTFHYTNCSPQHSAFNQSGKKGLWGQLENQITKEAKAKDLRLSYIAGPVMAARDPVLWGVRVPRQFWKVVLCVNDETGKLDAFAVLLSQSELVAGVREEAPFSPGEFKPYLVSVARLEQLTDVRFPDVVKRADVRRSRSPEERIELAPGTSIYT